MGEEKRRVWKKRSTSINCTETYRKGMYARYFDPTKRGQTDTKEQGSEYESDVGVVDTPLCSDAPAFDAPAFDAPTFDDV